MSVEYFDVLNSDGTKTGKIKERDKVHTDGDWHGSVHIWFFKDGKVLLQKRRDDKESFPSCYDAACTGHIAAGEEPSAAAVREVKEELNLDITESDLGFLYTQKLTVHDGDFISNEVNNVYVMRSSVSIENLAFEEEAISELLWIAPNELLQRLKNKESGFCMTAEEFETVQSHARQKKLI